MAESASTAQCPMCLPRTGSKEFWIEVAPLSHSTLYLDRNQTYRGQCVLAFDPRHVEGLEDLTEEEFRFFSENLRAAGQAIARVCRPDLMNYASLGNIIPHLHWHIVPRYESDPRWGGPIYTTTREEMHETGLLEAEYDALVDAIRKELVQST